VPQRGARLWDWAAKAYAADGVEAACLELQDGYDQNIPYLLWAAWAAVEGRRLDGEALEAGADCARAWDAAATGALRALRRTLKKPIPDMDDAGREAVRAQVKAAELEAERRLLDQLETLAPAGTEAPLPLLTALVEAARAWSKTVPRAQLQTLTAKLSA
jgi:uncharacterized protein (TIGR02444 family)